MRKPIHPYKTIFLFPIITLIFLIGIASTGFAASSSPAPVLDEEDDCLELIAAGVAQGIGHAGAALGKSFFVEEDVGTGNMWYWFNAQSAFDTLTGTPATQAGIDRYGVQYTSYYEVTTAASGYQPENKLTHMFNLGPWGFRVVTSYAPNMGNPNEDVEDNFTDVAFSVASYYLEQYQTYGYCSDNPNDLQSQDPVIIEEPQNNYEGPTDPGGADDDVYSDDDYYDDTDDVFSCTGDCEYAVCNGDVSFYGNPECINDRCWYDYEDVCANGCNDATGYCYEITIPSTPDSDFSDLLPLLLLGGGVITVGGGVLGGGILGLRALRRRQAIQARQLMANQLNRPVVDPTKQRMLDQMNQTQNRIDALLNELNRQEKAHLQHGLDHSIKMMESYHRSAAATENIAMLPEALKDIADFGADLVGLAPGAGRYFKWGYHSITTGLQEGIEKGFWEGAKEGVKKGLDTAFGDYVGDKVSLSNVKDVARYGVKTNVKAALKKTGVKTIQKNYMKDKLLSQGINDIKDTFGELGNFLLGR